MAFGYSDRLENGITISPRIPTIGFHFKIHAVVACLCIRALLFYSYYMMQGVVVGVINVPVASAFTLVLPLATKGIFWQYIPVP